MTEQPFNNETTQSDRREFVENEKRLRERGTTFHQFAQAEADTPRGRFAAQEKSTVTGAAELPKYPQLPPSSPWAGPDPVPAENPLGVNINSVESDR